VRKAGSGSNLPIDCEAVGEAISARMDGEELPIAGRVLRAHLAACPACRDFEARVADLGRPVALTSARPIPDDLVPALTAMVEPSYSRSAWPARHRLRTGPRFRWTTCVQWAAATVPALVAVVAISMGAGSHVHLVPTRPPSPCTAGLAHHAPRAG
jgi:predicted anti-sigma-YlaC factor YlaD